MKNNKKSLASLTFAIAIPLALQNVIAFAVNMADTVMLGQMGEVPLSASALANQVFFIVTLAVGGIAGGANVLTAQAWGKQDVDGIHRIMAYAYRTALGFALLVTLAAVAFPTAIMGVFTTDGAVVAEGARYLRIVGFSYLFYTITTVTGGVLQSVHTVRISMVASAVAMGLNIFLNWVLIFGKLGAPALGIAGAAIATLCARVVEFLLMMGYVYLREDKLRLRVKKLLRLDKGLAKLYLSTSVPVIANELFWALGEAALAVVLGRMGTEVVAANSICAVSVNMVSVLTRGVTAACCIIVANTVGAEQMANLPRQKRYFQRMSIIMGLAAGLLMLLTRPLLLSFYNIQAETLAFATQIIYIEAFLQVFRAYQLMNMMGILRGGGDVRFAMLNDLIFLWGLAVPLGFITGLALHLPPAVVYVAIKLDQIIKCFTSEVRLRGGKWVHVTTRRTQP